LPDEGAEVFGDRERDGVMPLHNEPNGAVFLKVSRLESWPSNSSSSSNDGAKKNASSITFERRCVLVLTMWRQTTVERCTPQFSGVKSSI